MEVSTALLLASRLYQLAGLPVSLDSVPPSPARLLFTAVCFCSYAMLSLFNTYVLLTTDYENGFETYSKLFWALYPLVCAVVTTAMAFQYQSFTRMSLRVEYVQEMLRERRSGERAVSVIWQVSNCCLAVFALSSLTLSLITNAHEFINTYNAYAHSNGIPMMTVVEFILHLPSTVLFFAILYHCSLQYLTELQVVEEVSKEVAASASVLLPVAEDRTARNLRELLDIYCQQKRVRLETERWLHFPLCTIMFSAGWFFPILASQYREPDKWIYLYVLTIYVVVGTALKIAPVCLNQLVEYRKSLVLGQLSREVTKTEDPVLKKILFKLFSSIRDNYTNSPDVLLDFNFSILSMLVDLAVLVLTTFY